MVKQAFLIMMIPLLLPFVGCTTEEDEPILGGDESTQSDGDEPAEDGDEPIEDGDEPIEDGDETIEDGDETIEDGDEPIEDGDETIEDGDETIEDGDEPECSLDCAAEGACPPDAALGCTCVHHPQEGEICMPICETDEDCPAPPDVTLVCDAEGFCIPGEIEDGDEPIEDGDEPIEDGDEPIEDGDEPIEDGDIDDDLWEEESVDTFEAEDAIEDGDTDEGAVSLTYPIVDTAQTKCFDNSNEITCPSNYNDAFFGQDAQYVGNEMDYTVSDDSTMVFDNVTGLTWQRSPETTGDNTIDADDKLLQAEAVSYCENLVLGGYSDWRLPHIKEIYSLMDFRGMDTSGYEGEDTSSIKPFVDETAFDFAFGDTSAGERIIDSQWATTTIYESTVMGDSECMFGLNLADGRIKCYPTNNKEYYTICVRGNEAYGENDFENLGDGTIMDHATGLMWERDDSGEGLNWEEALAYVQTKNDEAYLGYTDWRLPNAKELQSLLDYTRSPDTTGSAAIDPIFNVTPVTNEAGVTDYPWYYTATSHINYRGFADGAVYVCFGEALGYWQGAWQDVHGAGAQRSDYKAGDPSDYPEGHGPQGDAIRIYNHVRLVRGGVAEFTEGEIVDGDIDTIESGCSLDCAASSGNCPAEANLGCECGYTMEGDEMCKPICSTASDCPSDPMGGEMLCSEDGYCLPGQP